MIEFTRAYKTSDGRAHTSLAEAQKHEIVEILLGFQLPTSDAAEQNAKDTAEIIVEHAEQIVDILTTTATSKPKARRINGGKKTRTPKPAAVTATEGVAS